MNSINPFIYLITDNTGSMGEACRASQQSTAEVRATANLILGGERVIAGVVGDYDTSTPDSYQGGVAFLDLNLDESQKAAWFAKYLKPCGGGGTPEAYRTLFNLLLKRDPGIVFLFCDAPPHGCGSALDSEGNKEKAYIEKGSMIWEWEKLAQTVRLSGFQVVTFLTSGSPSLIKIYAQMGDVVVVPNNTSSVITKTMLTVLYALLNQPQDESVSYHYLSNPNDPNSSVTTKRQITPAVKIDLLAVMRQASPEFVMKSFMGLLQTQSVMCLTTSPVLGKYWRTLICGKYQFMENGKYAEAVKAIMDQLSRCSDKLTADQKAVFKRWIDESHDQTAICRELVAKAIANAPETGEVQSVPACLVLPEENKGKISLEDVLELGRGGDFRVLVDLITGLQPLQVMPTMPDDTAPEFLPLSGLSDSHTFQLIGSLLKPGFMFSPTVAYLVAIMSLNNKYLSERAHNFLRTSLGKWIKWELSTENGKEVQKYPVFWSINFMRLLKLVPDELLTDEERKFRDHYLTVARIARNQKSTMELTVPLILSRLRQDVTWKRLCDSALGGCGIKRCFSIFPGDSNICGHCIVTAPTHPGYKRSAERGQEMDPKKHLEKDERKTDWAQCYTCKGNYGVTEPDKLKVRAKCHNCREGSPPELVECFSCLHKYVSPGGSARKAILEAYMEDDDASEILGYAVSQNLFVCPRCVVHPSDMVATVETQLADIIEENPKLKSLVPLEPYDVLTDANKKLWKRVLEVTVSNIALNETIDFVVGLTYQGYTVHKQKEVLDLFRKTLMTHSGQTTCPMCIEDRPVRAMVEICGSCPNRVCQTCANTWYSQFVIGRVVNEAQTQCPYCKSKPKHALIKHQHLSQIRNLRPNKTNGGNTCPWSPDYIYAACYRCLTVQPAVARDCAGAVPDINNFVCEGCRASQTNMPTVNTITKECPSCGVQTEKRGGCNHLSCTCGAHWCWSCGQGSNNDGQPFNSHSIYDHMSSCGGIFPEDANHDNVDPYDDDSATEYTDSD